MTALDEALKRVGGVSAMAKHIGISRQAIWKWRREIVRLPAERAIEVERVSGVPRHELRPDLWPAPQHTGAGT